jgi:hypothetical protein
MTCRDILHCFLEDGLRAWLRLVGWLPVSHSHKGGIFSGSARPETSGLAGGSPEISHRVGSKPDRGETREKTEASGKGTPSGDPPGVGPLPAAGPWNANPRFSRQRLQAL